MSYITIIERYRGYTVVRLRHYPYTGTKSYYWCVQGSSVAFGSIAALKKFLDRVIKNNQQPIYKP